MTVSRACVTELPILRLCPRSDVTRSGRDDAESIPSGAYLSPGVDLTLIGPIERHNRHLVSI
jgi:hypothetical protein